MLKLKRILIGLHGIRNIVTSQKGENAYQCLGNHTEFKAKILIFLFLFMEKCSKHIAHFCDKRQMEK